MKQRDEDAARELESYIEIETAENIARGMRPDEARYAALRKLGNTTAVKERVHEMNGWSRIESLAVDVRQAVRAMRLHPRYALTVAVTLAICIAANTAVFAVVNSVLLRPLPVPDSHELVLLANRYPGAGIANGDRSAPGDYMDRQREVPALGEQALFQRVSRTIDTGSAAEQIEGMAATPSLLRLLRISPLAGRWFLEAEGEPGSHRKVLLSEALWRQMFGGDPGAIGRDLRLSGVPYTIVGIMPATFSFFDPEVRYWIPIALSTAEKQQRHSTNYFHIARRKPDASVALVQQQVNALNAANLDRFPKWKAILLNAGFHTVVLALADHMVADVRNTLFLLWAAAAFVVLIGALNVASLAAARMAARARELSTRLALGAKPLRVARQLAIENLVLALIGGAAGCLLASLIVATVRTAVLDRLPRAAEIRVDASVVTWALAIAATAAIVIAAVQTLRVLQTSVADSIREAGRTASAGRRTAGVRKALVVAQVACAFVLLSGAGLAVASFQALVRVDPGYSTDGVVTGTISPPGGRYPREQDLQALLDRSLTAIRALPGIASAGATSGIPLSPPYDDAVLLAEDRELKPAESVVSPTLLIVTPGYLETMRVKLIRGRLFDERDRSGSTKVVLVDETLARKFWGDADPIGRRVFMPRNPGQMKPDATTDMWTVVGVVPSLQLATLAGADGRMGAYYFPFAQRPTRAWTFAMRGGTASDLRGALTSVDPGIALSDVRTMRERTALSLASRRTAMQLASAFGGIALFLAAGGLYGVLSYLVVQRRREIGIRMAVGSNASDVFRLFLKEGAVLTAAGFAAGVAGTAMLRETMAAHVYGVRPMEPLVLAGAGALLALISVIACVWPAREAAMIDPVVVLHEG